MNIEQTIAALERAASEDYLYQPDVDLLRALSAALGRAQETYLDYTRVLILPLDTTSADKEGE